MPRKGEEKRTNPNNKARQQLIDLTTQRVIDDAIHLGQVDLFSVIDSVANEHYRPVLLYWIKARENATDFTNLKTAILQAITQRRGNPQPR